MERLFKKIYKTYLYFKKKIYPKNLHEAQDIQRNPNYRGKKQEERIIFIATARPSEMY